MGEVNGAGRKGKQTALGFALPLSCWLLIIHKELEQKQSEIHLSSFFKEDGRVRD